MTAVEGPDRTVAAVPFNVGRGKQLCVLFSIREHLPSFCSYILFILLVLPRTYSLTETETFDEGTSDCQIVAGAKVNARLILSKSPLFVLLHL